MAWEAGCSQDRNKLARMQEHTSGSHKLKDRGRKPCLLPPSSGPRQPEGSTSPYQSSTRGRCQLPQHHTYRGRPSAIFKFYPIRRVRVREKYSWQPFQLTVPGDSVLQHLLQGSAREGHPGGPWGPNFPPRQTHHTHWKAECWHESACWRLQSTLLTHSRMGTCQLRCGYGGNTPRPGFRVLGVCHQRGAIGR